MTDLSKLRWQCRRGMRELDILLERYLNQDYAASSEADKAAFRELLALADPQLADYLLRGERPAETHTALIVERILGGAQA